MHRLTHGILVFACAIVGCARHDIVPGVSDSAFVSTLAELRQVEGSTTDTVALAAARRRILQQRGLTAAQMDRAARALANDPQRAADIFDAVAKHAVNTPTDSVHRKTSDSAGKR